MAVRQVITSTNVDKDWFLPQQNQCTEKPDCLYLIKQPLRHLIPCSSYPVEVGHRHQDLILRQAVLLGRHLLNAVRLGTHVEAVQLHIFTLRADDLVADDLKEAQFTRAILVQVQLFASFLQQICHTAVFVGVQHQFLEEKWQEMM